MQKKFETLLMTVACTVELLFCSALTNTFHMTALKISIRMMHRLRTMISTCMGEWWLPVMTNIREWVELHEEF